MKTVSIEIMFSDLNEEAQKNVLKQLGIDNPVDYNLDIVPMAIYETEVCECPNGGDESDNCDGCPYAPDYRYDPQTGNCIRREDNEICKCTDEHQKYLHACRIGYFDYCKKDDKQD